MRSLRDSVAAKFMQGNCIKGIAKDKGLVAAGASVQQLGQCLNLDKRVEAGTFEDKARSRVHYITSLSRILCLLLLKHY